MLLYATSAGGSLEDEWFLLCALEIPKSLLLPSSTVGLRLKVTGYPLIKVVGAKV